MSRIFPIVAVATSVMSVSAGCSSSSGPARAIPKGNPPAVTTSTAPAPVSAVFTQKGGCGDAFFWAANADATLAVTVSVEARARSATKSTVIAFELPDPRVQVEVQHGRSLLQPFCNDVVNVGVWKVTSRSRATGGTGRIVLAPGGTPTRSCGVGGEVHIRGLRVGDGSRLGPVDVATRSIGCYAG